MIIFVGSMYLEGELEWCQAYSKTAPAVSSDTHQKAIVKGLAYFDEVFVVNRLPCGFYPGKIKRAATVRREYENAVSIKCSNLPLVRDVQLLLATVREVSGVCKKHGAGAVIGYMPFLPRMLALCILKRRFRNIPVSVIVPDLPQHSYPKGGNPIRFRVIKTIRRLEGLLVNALSPCVDSYIYLTEQMHQVLGRHNDYIVQEAIYMPAFQVPEGGEPPTGAEGSSFTYLYSGKINRENGLDRLVAAFRILPYPDVRLVLCGSGELLDALKREAEKDPRIVCLNQLSHAEVLAAQQRATVLVNPRYTRGENTAFSFPSKLIEYLGSGRPVISSRLPGIPGEYDPYLIYIGDDGIDAMVSALKRAYSYTRQELHDFGERGRCFVEENKSARVQGEKMYTHIKQLQSRLSGI